MSDPEEAAELLRIAERELRALKGMRDAEVFADEVFGFLAQQAVEKALKAWLCIVGAEYPLTHDLTALLSLLQDTGEDVQDFSDVVELNPFAVQLRYGTSGLEEGPLGRIAIIKLVEAIIATVRARVSERQEGRQ